jgi:hypothetical protein
MASRVMIWRSKYRRTKSVSRLGESGMGLFFLSDQRQNVAPVVEKITQGVENLGLGDPQGFGDVENRFALLMEGDHMTDCHTQPINDGLTAADSFEADDVWMFGFNRFRHARVSKRGFATINILTRAREKDRLWLVRKPQW